MPKKKDRIDLYIKAGAFVLPPKRTTPAPDVAPTEATTDVVEPKPDAPQDEVATDVAIEPLEEQPIPSRNVDVIAEALTRHFQKLDRSKPDSTRADFRDFHAGEDIGTRQEGIVVAFYPEKEVGFIRLLKYDRSKSGLFFHTSDVIEGELIGFGSQVSCLVSVPMRDRESLTAREIKILQP